MWGFDKSDSTHKMFASASNDWQENRASRYIRY
jgi:hypothetical protein